MSYLFLKGDRPLKYLLPALLVLTSVSSEAANWKIVPQDSWFKFEVRAENTPVQGAFRKFFVEMDFAPANLDTAKLSVRVSLEAADMDDESINEAISGVDWFAVSQFPQAVYTSRSISRAGEAVFRSRGTLVVKGTAQPVSVPFTWSETDSTATMAGEFILFRTDFDVGTGEWAGNEPISTDVRLWFEVRLEKSE